MKLLIEFLKSTLDLKTGHMLPAGRELLWQWFTDLSRARTYNAAGPNPIAYGEIEAYARLHRWPLRPDHITALRQLDDAYLEHAYAKRQGAPEGVKTLPPLSEHPMTGAMFDALFG